ncbi:helix-turn-helix domain-containing protein [uncultured Clostridium sp.]|uniref:helix-turn-helix domain-containing protein n=2 Tax=uncultured Clostridium sp. TaxID=59620 RepID=UPI0025CEA592|nr:helix-turn-helix domain-containing protein [uncultured Clostridium sp.]
MFELSFSKSIKNFRKENNLSQAEFANMLQVSRTTVVSYEKGTKEPTLYVLFRAAKIMNCSLDELVGINSPENKVKIYNNLDDNSTLKLQEELNKKLNTLNKLIKRYRRSFEELNMSKKRTDRMLEELNMSKRRNDRMLEELNMSKRRNDLMYEELKRTINRVSKSEDDFTEIINSLSLDIKKDISAGIEDLSDSPKIEVEYISIPEFSCIACGSPIEPENDIEDFIDLPLIPPLNPDKISSYFVVTASGESMNEICQHGEKIVLMSLQASCSDIKSGDILAISIDNCLTLKELILNSNHDMVTLKPHSTDPEFVETTYTCKEFKTLEIKGKFICTVNELYDKAEELSK